MSNVSSLSKHRERVQRKKDRANRLAMLMDEFLEAEKRGDLDGMRMYGRGLNGYSRDELNAAEKVARKKGTSA